MTLGRPVRAAIREAVAWGVLASRNLGCSWLPMNLVSKTPNQQTRDPAKGERLACPQEVSGVRLDPTVRSKPLYASMEPSK